jgi:arylsulfatase A
MWAFRAISEQWKQFSKNGDRKSKGTSTQRDGKGSTWEGGMRVPGIAWMPGRIRPSVSSGQASTLDLFPTAIALSGSPAKGGSHLDGRDLSPLLFDSLPLPDRPFFYYRGDEIFACRIGEWKAHFKTRGGYGPGQPVVHEPPLLFHLGRDPGENRNVASEHPSVINDIRTAVESHHSGVTPGVPQLH